MENDALKNDEISKTKGFSARTKVDLIFAKNFTIANLMNQRIGDLTGSASDNNTNWIFDCLEDSRKAQRKNAFYFKYKQFVFRFSTYWSHVNENIDRRR